MPAVRIDNLSVSLDGHPVLRDVSVDVPDGAFAAVIGPSGSGKSTLLRAMAGLVGCDRGRILFGNRDVTDTATRDRNIGMVSQMPAMLPRRNVRRNVAFPLELRRETAESIRQRVDAETRAMHVEHLLQRDPTTLSRGEQQLVQIARTMVQAPGTLLLDEPFAALDAHLRVTMRAEIGMLQRGYGLTTVMATNDPDDVTALATHLVVLSRWGDEPDSPFTAVQSGPPDEVARDPVSLEVAGAVATLWTVPAVVDLDGAGFWLVVDRSTGSRTRAWAPALRAFVGADVVIGFRNGDLAADPKGELIARFERRVPGSAQPLLCRLGSHVVQASSDDRAPSSFEPGAAIRLHADHLLVFDPQSGRRLV